MSIKTSISPLYAGQKLFAVVLCAVFGLWGAYDYAIKIPRKEATFLRFEQLKSELEQLDKSKSDHQQHGTQPSQAERDRYSQVTTELNSLTPGGNAPTRPSKWDRTTQWLYIACLPFAFWFLWLFIKAKRQHYELDDGGGTLHFQGDPEFGQGAWAREQIVDIDMSRWMAKSVAYLIDSKGTRLKLDAYLHKDLHLIIGAIASRFYPDKWDAQAKEIKHLEDLPEAPGQSENDEGVEENAASSAP